VAAAVVLSAGRCLPFCFPSALFRKSDAFAVTPREFNNGADVVLLSLLFIDRYSIYYQL
jgi:hypothetical protein